MPDVSITRCAHTTHCTTPFLKVHPKVIRNTFLDGVAKMMPSPIHRQFLKCFVDKFGDFRKSESCLKACLCIKCKIEQSYK